MSAALPARPNLEHLKKQAKALLDDYRQHDPAAVERFLSLGSAPTKPQLADAQHVIAREHGFSNWTELKTHVTSLGEQRDPRQALIAAVQARDVAAARSLLAGHASLRARINDPAPDLPFGARPISAVAGTQDRAMIDLFLEFGADINARSDWAPGSWGVLDGCDPAFAPFLMSRGARVDAHSAAHLGLLAELQTLVAADPALVHARGGDGQTPLHFARSIEVADYLLAQGADIDALDVDHEGTPAQWMISDRTELARHLVRRGARTDILMAVALGDAASVRAFLDAEPAAVRTSAIPEHFPTRGPLAAGHIYLWSLGRNKTAHQIARDSGHDDVWLLLMQRSPDDVKLAEACRLGDEQLITRLLAGNPALTQALPNETRRKLVDAAEDENVDAVKRMLAAGWPTDARGHDDATALHWAAFLGNAEIVRELLKHGAAADARENTYGGTPISWGMYGSVHGWRCRTGDFVGAIEALLSAGAIPPERISDASPAVRQLLQATRA